MLRCGSTVLAVLSLTAAPVTAAEPAKVTLRWFGQSFFQLQTSAGTKIVFDPHALEVYGKPTVEADIVLMSHLHSDHTQVGAVKGKFEAISGLTGKGAKTTWNLIDKKIKDVHIKSVGVYHDQEEGAERGKNTIFIVEADGLRIVHLGDLGHELTAKQIEAIGKVDVLMIPVGGVYALNGTEAKKVMSQLKPRLYVLPMHYGTRVFDDLLPLDEFLDGQKHVKKMEKTNDLVIPTDLKLDHPETVILGWEAPVAVKPK